MVRKMAYIGFSYAVGLFLASFFSYPVDLILTVGIVILAFGYTYFINLQNAVIPVCMITVAIALTAYGLYEEIVYKPILEYSGKTAVLEGTVLDIRYYSEDYSGYIIKGKLDGRSGTFMLYCETLSAEYYDTVSAVGKVKAFENSYAFPTESYNKSQGIFVEMSYPSQVDIQSGFSIRREILRYRDYLYDRICTFLPGEEGAVLTAMLCGDKNGLDNDTKTLLYRAGIGHIMSVSGLHLTILAAIVSLILKGIFINKWLRFILMEAVVLAFAVFAGLSESVLRAVAMVTIVFGADLFKRQSDTLNSLGIFLLLFLAGEPFAIRNTSLVLSSVGVVGLGVIAPTFTAKITNNGLWGKLLRSLTAAFCVTVTLFPFSVLFFDEISLVSPLVNIILIPFCSIALLCGVLVAFTGGISLVAFPLLMIAGLCGKVILAVSKWSGSVRWFYLPAGYAFLEVTVLLAVVAVLAAFFLFHFRSRKKLCLILAACTAAVSFCIFSNRVLLADTLTVTVLGDTDGSSLLVVSGETAYIVDLCGGRKPPKNNQKYLQRAGIRDVKFIVMPSYPETSIAAYAKRFQLFQIEQIFVPEESTSLLSQPAMGVVPKAFNTQNAVFEAGDFQIQILANNTVRVVFGDFSVRCVDGESESLSTEDENITVVYLDGQKADVSGEILLLDEGFAGYEIICRQDGKYSTRRIPNGNRQ